MKRHNDIVNYGTIFIIAILLILVFFNLVPNDWYITLLIISLGVLVIRIMYRAYFINQNKKMKSGG